MKPKSSGRTARSRRIMRSAMSAAPADTGKGGMSPTARIQELKLRQLLLAISRIYGLRGYAVSFGATQITKCRVP